MISLDIIYSYILLLCSFLGFVYLIFCIKNKTTSSLNSLPFFVLLIYFIEQWGGKLGAAGIPNAWLYNYFSLLEFSYYNWLISRMFISKKNAKLLIIITLFYIVITLINILFFQGKTGYHSVTHALGVCLLVGSCVYYFYQLLLFPTKKLLFKQPQFWVCVALIFSYTASFPIFCLNNLFYDRVTESIWPIISIFIDLINITFYTLFTISTFCNLELKKLFFHRKILLEQG